MCNKLYQIRDGVEIEDNDFELDDDILVFDMQVNKVYVLNKTAGYILHLLQKEMELAELLHHLYETFNPKYDIEFDVRTILSDFEKNNLINVSQVY